MGRRDLLAVSGAALAALTLALGGGFWGPERLAVAALATAFGASAVALREGRVTTTEALALAVVGWGLSVALVRPLAPLAAKETLVQWLVAWLLWLAVRRAGPSGLAASRVVLVAAACFGGGAVLGEVWGANRLRMGGLLENPNLTAALLVTTLPCCLELPRRLAVPTVMVVAGGVVLSGSRAGVLALVVASVLYLRPWRARLVAAVAGGVVAATVMTVRLVLQPEVLAWHRPSIWVAALRLAGQHLMTGVGPGGLPDAATSVRILHPEHIGQHQFVLTFAESTPLAVLVQLGLPGLVLLVLAALAWLRGPRLRAILDHRGARAVLGAMATMAAFHDLLTAPVVLWWWSVQLGLLEASAGAAPSDASAEWPRSTRLVATLATTWVLIWGLVQPAAARWRWSGGAISEERVRQAARLEPLWEAPMLARVEHLLTRPTWQWETAAEARAWAERAVAVHPGRAHAWADLGRVHARVVVDLGAFAATVETAREAFGRAVELDPFLPWVWLEWAQMERLLGADQRARELVRRALDSEPSTVAAWLLLARLELDRGRVEPARRALDRALELRRTLRHRDLTSYERDLVAASAWQIEELEGALR